MIIYRDGSGALVALDMETAKKWRRPYDPNKEALLGVACSPDGSHIAYLRQDFSQVNREITIGGEGPAVAPISVGSLVQGVAWAPDSKRLAYIEFDPKVGYSISAIDIASGQTTQIVHGPGYAAAPRWSPDGTRIAYQAQTESHDEVFVYDVAAGEPRPKRLGNDNNTRHTIPIGPWTGAACWFPLSTMSEGSSCT